MCGCIGELAGCCEDAASVLDRNVEMSFVPLDLLLAESERPPVLSKWIVERP